MSFLLSKLVWGLFAPATVLFLTLTAGWLLLKKTPRLARSLLALSSIFLTLLILTPIGSIALWPIEHRFTRPTLDHLQVDGIVVLGAAIDASASRKTGAVVLNDSAERLTEMMALARRFPAARVIYSGGSGSVRNDQREADVAAIFLQQQGFDVARVSFERNSRNTYENAIESKKIADPNRMLDGYS